MAHIPMPSLQPFIYYCPMHKTSDIEMGSTSSASTYERVKEVYEVKVIEVLHMESYALRISGYFQGGLNVHIIDSQFAFAVTAMSF